VGVARRNLELKARDVDLEQALGTCKRLGAEDGGTLLQKDTYFDVPKGRLKLRREGNAAHLIAYERPDLPGQRESRYRIVEIVDPPGLEEALAGVLGITAVVNKERRLFLFESVRIHLDRVDGLGHFIELEGVAAPGELDLSRPERLLTELRGSLGIDEADLIGESYCDLILSG
jgi:predicted adenylyl cyclase CyaB